MLSQFRYHSFNENILFCNEARRRIRPTLVEGLRRLDQPSPHPHLSKEIVDCLLCAAPSDSEDDRRRMTRNNTRKGIRLDRLMRYFNVQHRSKPSIEGMILLHYSGFSRSTAGLETVGAAHPRSPNSELDPMESTEPILEVARHEQQPQQHEHQQHEPVTSSHLPSATAEIITDMGHPY